MFTTIASRLTRRSTLPVIYHGQHHHRYTYQRFDRFANLRAFSSESLAAAAAADDDNVDASAQSIDQDDDNNTSSTSLPQLPIATFIDLDNVGPKTFSRTDAISFISPLLQLGRLINDTNSSDESGERLENILKKTQEGGDIKKKSKSSSPAVVVRRLLQSLDVHIEAFGNLATRSYRSEQERDRTIDDQEYIQAEEFDDGMIIAQTGYDEEGLLRCGVCGSIMKLSKKDRKAGKTLESKLRQHMKIHDREQNKRKKRMAQGGKGKGKKGKLNAKEMKKFIKYEAAQVGLKRSNIKATKSGKIKKSPNTKNDLFRVIREVGVKVKPADNVDAKLVTAAKQWMNKISETQQEWEIFALLGNEWWI